MQCTYILLQINWSTKLDASDIHLQFLNLVNLLTLNLSAADVLAFNVAEELCHLKASNFHNISLFSRTFLSRINNLDSYFLIKVSLIPFISWLDHSILKHLVSVSENEAAAKSLQQFDSLIDYTQPITSYPIPAPSQLLVPLYASDYTLVATKCDFDFEEVTLQRVVDMKTLLIEKWEITDHALQLVAVLSEQRILYWIIPKCVASIVENRNPQYELENGIITNFLLSAKSSLDQSAATDVLLTSDPFYFLDSKVGICIVVLSKDLRRCSTQFQKHLICI